MGVDESCLNNALRVSLRRGNIDAPGRGGSITNSVEAIAAGVIRAKGLPTTLVWIEHWPEETTEGQETFELVVFSSYEVVERVPYLRETRA
jgi:hypothetical protein